MSVIEKINLGIVGACGRGGAFRRSCEVIDQLNIHAVCDINEKGLQESAQALGAGEMYTDYDQMLDKSDLDVVIIGTPMPLHVPQSIAALKKGLHVISEVPAGVNVAECKELVQAANASAGIYMMAENYIYTRNNQVVKEMVRRGEFGKTY